MEDVRTAAKGFLALGLERFASSSNWLIVTSLKPLIVRFHTVGCLGYNAPEWALANVAAVHAGGFGMGIYQVSEGNTLS